MLRRLEAGGVRWDVMDTPPFTPSAKAFPGHMQNGGGMGDLQRRMLGWV